MAELERPCPLPPGRHRLQVPMDGSVCVAVVDGQVALSARLYDWPAGRIGYFTYDGEAHLARLDLLERDSPAG